MNARPSRFGISHCRKALGACLSLVAAALAFASRNDAAGEVSDPDPDDGRLIAQVELPVSEDDSNPDPSEESGSEPDLPDGGATPQLAPDHQQPQFAENEDRPGQPPFDPPPELDAPPIASAAPVEPPPPEPFAFRPPNVDSNVRFYGATAPQEITSTLDPLLGQGQMALFSQQATSSKFQLLLGFGVGAVFDDNIDLTKTNKKSELIITVAPTIGLRLGHPESDLMITGAYTPAGVFYLNHTSRDSIDQAGRLDVAAHLPKLTLGLHLGMQSVEGNSIDAGEQVRRNSFYAGITSTYAYSDKTSFDLNADYTTSVYHGLLDSQEVRVQGFVNYQIGAKLQLGVGGLIGWLEQEGGPSQVYEQGLFRAVYTPTAKLTLNTTFGFETRQIGGGGGTDNSPYFSIGAAWAPRDRLTFTIDARRRTFASAALAGQNYVATGVVATVNAVFTPSLSGSLALGFDHAEYKSTETGVDASRTDNYFYVRPSLDWHVSKHWTVGVFYEFSTDHSSGFGGNPFSRNRAGALVSFNF